MTRLRIPKNRRSTRTGLRSIHMSLISKLEHDETLKTPADCLNDAVYYLSCGMR